MLDISAVSSFADYFVIATALNVPHMAALTNVLTRDVPHAGGHRPRIEGETDSGWQVFDYGNVVVHLFTQEQRAYYGLEALWSRGRQLLRME